MREALRLSERLRSQWNELTSECTGEVCTVSSTRIRAEYLGDDSPLLSLAADGDLRAPSTLALVPPSDREAYVRNAMRFESSMRYVASCASLAQFDPKVPPFPKGGYVAKGLKDERGNLLGLSLENARDFLLDASDALRVACSFISYGAEI